MDYAHCRHLMHYAIIEKLGEGLSGVVFRAWDTVQLRFVAVKQLWPELTPEIAFSVHYLTATQALRHCTHPGIVPVYDIHTDNDPYLIVTEYIKGDSLREIIKRGPLDNHRFLNYAIQIAEALTFAHRQLITHGNIKPSNIIVAADGHLWLTDFGLTCGAIGDPADLSRLTPQTAGYLAPEQIAGEQITPLTDFFSLGTLAYEMLTGHNPFAADTVEAVHENILRAEPDIQALKTRKVPGDTILMIEKLLAKDSSERFGSGGELTVTLQAMRSYERQSPDQPFLKVKPNTPRQYLMLSMLAALLIILWLVVTTYR